MWDAQALPAEKRAHLVEILDEELEAKGCGFE